MQPALHLVILLLSLSCKAEVGNTNFNTSDAPVHFRSLHEDNSTTSVYNRTAPELSGQDVTTNKPTRTTASYNVTKQTTSKETKWVKSNYTLIPHNPNITANDTCTVNEKYKMGIIICVIVISVLVFITAVLIICIVVLANKVSALKAKLTQSKRQARSNGDFLSASSILWPSGMETWQKKTHEANLTMDEISLGDTNTMEKLKLMTTPSLARSRADTEDNKSLTTATMTTVSTEEV